MKKLFSLVLFFSIIVSAHAQKPNKNEDASLYDRLGGADGISMIVDDLVDAHMSNPAISKRFLPYKGTEQLKLVKQHTREFLSAGSGGPVTYTGRDMPTTHKGMNITAGEFIHAVDDMMLALDKNKIDAETKKDVLAILWSLKGGIIGL